MLDFHNLKFPPVAAHACVTAASQKMSSIVFTAMQSIKACLPLDLGMQLPCSLMSASVRLIHRPDNVHLAVYARAAGDPADCNRRKQKRDVPLVRVGENKQPSLGDNPFGSCSVSCFQAASRLLTNACCCLHQYCSAASLLACAISTAILCHSNLQHTMELGNPHAHCMHVQ